MFPLAVVFGALVFWLPGLIFSFVTSSMMSYSGRFSSIITPIVALTLGLVLFPAWVVLLDNPLGKGWHLIMGIGGLSALLASVFTQKIIKNANNAIHRTPTRVTPDA